MTFAWSLAFLRPPTAISFLGTNFFGALRYLSIISSAHWMPVDFIAAEYLVIRSSPGRTSDYAVERRPWLFFAALCAGQPRHFWEAFLPFSGSPPANGGLVVNKMTAL